MTPRDGGYAAAACMLAAAAFALVAAQVARTSRSEVRSATAEAARASLQADAEAGLAISLARLTAGDGDARWVPADAPQVVDFNGAHLTIQLEDERAKVPINTLSRQQVETLFRAAGATPERASQLLEAFLDWRDPQRADRKSPPAVPPRTGGFTTIYELRELDGMDAGLFANLEPVVTVSNGDTSFNPDAASSLALQVMQGSDSASVKGIERRRELAGERTALSILPASQPQARAITIRITAQDNLGNRARQAYLVELTGAIAHPYVVRGALPT